MNKYLTSCTHINITIQLCLSIHIPICLLDICFEYRQPLYLLEKCNKCMRMKHPQLNCEDSRCPHLNIISQLCFKQTYTYISYWCMS